MGRHEMGGPEPCRQRQPGSMHRRAGGNRSLPTAIEAFVQAWPAFQRSKAAFAASRTDETIRPAPLEHEGYAVRLVGECLLELGICKAGGPRSLVVTEGRGFYCFAAKTGGDQIELVRHIKGLEARQAGVFIVGEGTVPTV